VIYDQAVVALVQFEECQAGELPIVSEPNEPPAYELGTAGRIGEGHDRLFGREWFSSDREAMRVGYRTLKFDDRQSFRSGSSQPPDARSDELAAIAVRDLEHLPILIRERHGGSNMLGGNDRCRREEPAGPPHTSEAAMGRALRDIEMPHDADGRVRKLRGIDASCLDTRCVRKQFKKNKDPSANASTHRNDPPAQQQWRINSVAGQWSRIGLSGGF
jgi:hypothetical protein